MSIRTWLISQPTSCRGVSMRAINWGITCTCVNPHQLYNVLYKIIKSNYLFCMAALNVGSKDNYNINSLPSVLWHSCLGVRKSIRPVKIGVMRCWCGYLSGARCRLFAYGPADATTIPKPHHLLPHLNPDWFFLSGTQVVLENRPLNGCSSSVVQYK